ncbi:unnamed protein product [Hymenolepis diminuta]|uniref:Calponin-homology (CH) domain-containing protein n=1 Tax=Hymenolepis diminuta TaxID=6216 RepID=A0A158QDL5_HYMDI|nr:unnamed protein product [Hymenolepis diminuta]
MFNYRSRLEKTPVQNLGMAFHLITKEFAVARLLETEDLLSNDSIDARSVAIYLIELRAAVEMDRRRRNKPTFEIRTAAMVHNYFISFKQYLLRVTVTVATTSSRSSSPTASELTFCSEDTSDPDDTGHIDEMELNMSGFHGKVERSLAWILSIEERLVENIPQLKDVIGNDTKEERKNAEFPDPVAEKEKDDLSAMENLPLEEVKSLNEAIVERLSDARTRFNTHEDLTAHLTKHEPYVRRCLRYGQQLANLAERIKRISGTAPSSTTGNDTDKERLLADHLQSVNSSEVMNMLNFLHNRWTNLNRAAESGNRFLANCLINRQEALLRAVEIQLAKLEWEKDRQATERFGTTVPELKAQLSSNRRLENYLEFGETLARQMQGIVILVPSETPDARDADFEERIAVLATQWTRLVEWVHTHYARLQNALLHWRHFQEEADVLEEWLDQLEIEAREVERRKTKEMEQKMRRNPSRTEEQVLREARKISEAVSDAVVGCLSRYETRWAQLLASLDRRATSVREACGDSIEIQRTVETRVDTLVSRWSQLTEPHLDLDDNSDHPQDPNPRIFFPNMQHQNTVQLRDESGSSDGTKRAADSIPNTVPEKRFSLESGRIAMIPTGYRAEFESKAEKILNWLDSRIESLELAIMKSANEEQPEILNQENSQQFESPSAVTEKIDKELPEAKEDMVLVNTLGERYRKDLSQAGENVEELDQLFEDIEERWAMLDQLYKKASILMGDQVTSSQIVPSEVKQVQQPLAEKASKSICDSVKTFKQWLEEARTEATRQIYCKDGSELDEVIANFTRTVQKQPKSTVVEQFLASLSKEETSELRGKWQEVRELISERVPILQNLCENHDLFINQIERFEKLMSDMFEYLDSVAQAANSHSSAIEAQLGESIEALRDMEKMQPTLSHLDGIVKELQGFFDEAHIERLKNRLQELNQTWNRVKELTNENIEFLRSKLEKSSSLKNFVEEEKSEEQPSDSVTSYHSAMQESPITVIGGLPHNQQLDTVVKMIDMEELQKWISKAKHRFAKFTSINSREDMDKFEEFLKQFRKEIDVKRPMIEAMRNGDARDSMGKTVSSKTVLLFSGHFADLESEYAAGQERLKSATYHFNDFNSLMSYEKHWLERVDSMLKKSKKQAYVDAFDNLKSEHSEDDFARLKKIVELLSSEKIMSQKLNSEFETYAASVASALKQLIRRLDELKKLKQRTEDTQNRLDSYDVWLRDTTKNIQKKMRDGNTAASNAEELGDLYSQITEIDETVASIRNEIDKKSSSESLENTIPESLTEKLNSLQTDSTNFKRTLLLFTFPSNIQSSITRSREATREHDVAAVNLEIVSLTSDHIACLLKKSDNLVERIRDTQDLIDNLQRTASSTKSPSELRNALDELLNELKDLFEKNTKILDHVRRFREGLEELQPYADQYSNIIDPLDQVMMNVEEVTDYLETADTNHSHIDMLQRVLNELGGVLGREDREQNGPTKEGEKSTVEKLENLLKQIESSVTPIEGLNSTIADVRRIIDKAFAARNAFRVQINGLATESNESSVTEATEIPLATKTESNDHENTLKPSRENNINVASDETTENLLSVLYTRSNQLTAEIVAFFQDLDNFNKYCVNLDHTEKSPGENDLSEPLLTTIAKSEKKIEVCWSFYA